MQSHTPISGHILLCLPQLVQARDVKLWPMGKSARTFGWQLADGRTDSRHGGNVPRCVTAKLPGAGEISLVIASFF